MTATVERSVEPRTPEAPPGRTGGGAETGRVGAPEPAESSPSRLPAPDIRTGGAFASNAVPARAAITVEPVRSVAERDAFLALPYALHAAEPSWVPPLEMERRDFLDPARNPFLRHAQVELFLARRGGRVVGRIAACEDRRYNAFQRATAAFFGLYEVEDDDEAAQALFAAAERWARSRRLNELLGPASFGTNHELGLLVDGFGEPPALRMPYNPPRYVRQLEQVLGLARARDLWAWWLPADAPPPAKVLRVVERLREREGVRVRPVDPARLRAELGHIRSIYNEAWERNWGFVPLTEAEFDHLARELRPLLVPELCLFAEVGGEPVAFSLSLPDLNQALIHVGGRLTRRGLPLGLLRLLYWSRRIDQLRLLTLGVRPAFRQRGLDALLYLETLQAARRLGYRGGELSWTLEDNVRMNRAIEALGGRRTKTYRVYRRTL